MLISQKECILEIDGKLLEKYDVEGALISTVPGPLYGLLVLSTKNDTFALHFYKLQSNGKSKLYIEKKLTTKTFSTFNSMQFFLNAFSYFSSDHLIEFMHKFDK
jgi:hypothetical protein